MVNTAAITISRLSMSRSEENTNKNDIVTQLGIQGVATAVQARGARPFSTCRATPHGRQLCRHSHERLGHDHRRPRSAQLATRTPQPEFGASYRRYIWPMWGFFQNRGYYQFTNGFTTQTATNDGTGSALASFLMGLPAVKQRQAGIPQMQLRQWYADGFVQDSFQLTAHHHDRNADFATSTWIRSSTSPTPIPISTFQDGVPSVFIGGQNGYPKGLKYPNTHNFAPRFGISQNHSQPRPGASWRIRHLLHPRGHEHLVQPAPQCSLCFPGNSAERQLRSLRRHRQQWLQLRRRLCWANDGELRRIGSESSSQYIQQWSASVEKSFGQSTTLELGYLGAHGVHLQRAHLINNAPPGPGPIGPRRPFKTISFVPNTELPPDVNVVSTTFPVSTINLLENTAQSWYDAGYINVRRRYTKGFSLLANYTWSKNLSDAPDFRSPMFEASIPQNNNDLAAEKGPPATCATASRSAQSMTSPRWGRSACDRRDHPKLALLDRVPGADRLPIYDFSFWRHREFRNRARARTRFAPTRPAKPEFGPGTQTATRWFNTAAFVAPPAFTFGNVGRNSIYGPGAQTLDFAVIRDFGITERMRFQFRGEFFNGLNHTILAHRTAS